MTKTEALEFLKVTKDATPKEIQKAYHKLTFKYHPDHNPNNPKAGDDFAKLTEAYEIAIGKRRATISNDQREDFARAHAYATAKIAYESKIVQFRCELIKRQGLEAYNLFMRVLVAEEKARGLGFYEWALPFITQMQEQWEREDAERLDMEKAAEIKTVEDARKQILRLTASAKTCWWLAGGGVVIASILSRNDISPLLQVLIFLTSIGIVIKGGLFLDKKRIAKERLEELLNKQKEYGA